MNGLLRIEAISYYGYHSLQLAADTNLQEFILDLVEETKMFEDNKKVRKIVFE